MYSVSLQETSVQLKRITCTSACIGSSCTSTVSGGQGAKGGKGGFNERLRLKHWHYKVVWEVTTCSSDTCSALHRVTEGAVACAIWGLDREIVNCSTIKALDGASVVCAVTVQHVSIPRLGTAVVVSRVFSGCPWQRCRLILTVEDNGDSTWLARTWMEEKKILLCWRENDSLIMGLLNVCQYITFCMNTITCMQCCILTGFAGAVLVAGSYKYCVLLVTVEAWYTAVTGRGVASVHVSIYTQSDNVVGFSNRRGSPGHQCTVVPTGGVNHHIPRWTGLWIEEINLY